MQEAILNGFGDLSMNREIREVINKKVEVVKQTKSGLYQVRHNGNLYSVPKRNLDFLEEKYSTNSTKIEEYDNV